MLRGITKGATLFEMGLFLNKGAQALCKVMEYRIMRQWHDGFAVQGRRCRELREVKVPIKCLYDECIGQGRLPRAPSNMRLRLRKHRWIRLYLNISLCLMRLIPQRFAGSSLMQSTCVSKTEAFPTTTTTSTTRAQFAPD